jgi:hypothetical protein
MQPARMEIVGFVATRLADNLRIAAEAPLPQLVDDHCDGMRALSLVFAGKKAAAEHGANADGVEVVGGDAAVPLKTNAATYFS